MISRCSTHVPNCDSIGAFLNCCVMTKRGLQWTMVFRSSSKGIYADYEGPIIYLSFNYELARHNFIVVNKNILVSFEIAFFFAMLFSCRTCGS